MAENNEWQSWTTEGLENRRPGRRCVLGEPLGSGSAHLKVGALGGHRNAGLAHVATLDVRQVGQHVLAHHSALADGPPVRSVYECYTSVSVCTRTRGGRGRWRWTVQERDSEHTWRARGTHRSRSPRSTYRVWSDSPGTSPASRSGAGTRSCPSAGSWALSRRRRSWSDEILKIGICE